MPPISIPIDPVPQFGLSSEVLLNNFLIVVLDDLGTEQIRSYGEDTNNAYCPQPTFDRLAREGILFRKFYVTPACSMTRATFQFGRFGRRTGVGTLVEDTQQGPLLTETGMPRALKQATESEYVCGAFGKWHLSTHMNGRARHPLLIGYDTHKGSLRNLERGSEDYYSWNRYVDGTLTRCQNYATTQVFDDALEFIRAQGDGQPWLAWVALNTPHFPLHRPPADQYDSGLYDLPTREPSASATATEKIAYYKAMTQSADVMLGRLLDAMDPKVRAQTHVILTSDNGTPGQVVRSPLQSSHAKGACYELGVRVPLIWSGPSIDQPGRSTSELVCSVDFIRTVVDMAAGDWDLVDNPSPYDGVTFSQILTSRLGTSSRATAYFESFSPNGPDSGATKAGVRGITNGTYKLLTFSTGTTFPQLGGAGVGAQFYNLSIDPNETNNLLSSGDPAALTGSDLSNYNTLVSAYITQVTS